jgi:hypothetical protein
VGKGTKFGGESHVMYKLKEDTKERRGKREWRCYKSRPLLSKESVFSLLTKNESELMKSPVCLSVSATNKFRTDCGIIIKFDRQLMPLKVNSTPFFLILQLQAFQNGGRLNF